MLTVKVLLAFLSIPIFIVFGTQIQFYGEANYQSLLYTKDANHNEGCLSLPEEYRDKVFSVGNNGACVFLYEKSDCQGQLYRIGSESTGSYYIQAENITSFRICSLSVFVAENDEKQFYRIQTKMDWNQADAHCKSLNMKLASITSAAQATLLQDYFKNKDAIWYWTSGICRERNCTNTSQFTWQDGTPLDSSYISIIHKYGDQANTNHLCYHHGGQQDALHLDRQHNGFSEYVLCEVKKMKDSGCDFVNKLSSFLSST